MINFANFKLLYDDVPGGLPERIIVMDKKGEKILLKILFFSELTSSKDSNDITPLQQL